MLGHLAAASKPHAQLVSHQPACRPCKAPLSCLPFAQGIVKPALQRLRDSYSAKARELADQLLSLQVNAG